MKGSGGKNTARAARLFHALSDPTRLDIIRELKEGECCVCELTDQLQAGQSRLSFHLKVLKEAGLILGSDDNTRTCYCVNAERLEELKELIAAL